MILRNPDDLCVLCLTRKAAMPNSYFIPDGILAEIRSPDIHGKDISAFPTKAMAFDPNEKDQHNNTVERWRRRPYRGNYVFCVECETDLIKTDTEVIEMIETAVFHSSETNSKKERFRNDIELLTCYEIPSRLFDIFIFSLIWRISIRQWLEHETICISSRFNQDMQALLKNSIGSGRSLSEDDSRFSEYDYTVLTSDYVDYSRTKYVNPGPELTNPQLFYVGNYMVFINHKEDVDSLRVPGLSPEIFSREFENGSGRGPVKVAKVSFEIWGTLNQMMVSYGDNTFSETMVLMLSERMRVSLQQAADILQDKVDELGTDLDPIVFFNNLNFYFQDLMK